MAKKPLINVNVPKAGRIQTRDVVRFSVLALGLTAFWNWGPRIPYVGSYLGQGKGLILRLVGAIPPAAG